MQALRQKANQISEYPENGLLKFYISRQWLNKFNTFAEPGPISNYDFLCRHGGYILFVFICLIDICVAFYKCNVD